MLLPHTIFTVASELRFHITVGRAIRPSTVKCENWHVFNVLIIIDWNPHFNQAFMQAMYGRIRALIKMAYIVS